MHVITCYIPPYTTDYEFKMVNHLQWIVQLIFKKFKKSRIIVMGDFNQYCKPVTKEMKLLGLKPVFTSGIATHKQGGAIDQVFTNIRVLKKEIDEA